MRQNRRISIFIDAANLHRGTLEDGWHLDYQKFILLLRDKYHTANTYMFIGFMPRKQKLYLRLQAMGYSLIFKEVAYTSNKIKANCDTDLVLAAIVQYYEKQFDQAIIISSDGDYASLVRFLKNHDAFRILISPRNRCSYQLRKLNIPLLYLSSQRNKIEKISQKEKAPGEDKTSQGSLS